MRIIFHWLPAPSDVGLTRGSLIPEERSLYRALKNSIRQHRLDLNLSKKKKKKNEVRFESYLDLIKNVKKRVAVTKMRISCHLLPIESGRYKKIPRVERLCPLCNRSEIGDEFHYLLKCTHSSLSHIRGIFLESLYSINSNFTNMSYKALFLYIMSMCDQNILNLSASYIENILNCYASEP